jgi:hypothetical protein
MRIDVDGPLDAAWMARRTALIAGGGAPRGPYRGVTRVGAAAT